MTANEMADRNEWACCAYSKEVSAMLRQQQAEIESLKLRELTDEEIKEVYDQYFDLENFGWLHLQCIREILQKAREKND